MNYTPTEQADELISKMYTYAPYPECIKAAIITVELLIDCTHSEDITRQETGANGYDRYKKYTYEYWQDVKAELKQKLYQ
jgi:hypothetical protein